MRRFQTTLMLASTLALAACNGGDATEGVVAPDFQGGQGQAAAGTAAYAAGPYGIGKGSTITNYEFIGFPNAKTDTSALRPIELADFYNPHGNDPDYDPASEAEDDRLFPLGSMYNAKDADGNELRRAKPKVLLINVASVWCPPCNEEAKTILPPKYEDYAPRGGEFLLQLADGPTPGTPAQAKNLIAWTKRYGVDYPAAIDPSMKLSALFEADAFPANLIIDTTTMKIVEVLAGAPQEDDPFWKKFEALLDPAN